MPWPYNPYPTYPVQQFQQQQMIPSTQVTRVSGRPGAEAYTIGPNSSALLLDESGVIVWLVTTDGAGYKTVAPYDITPHKTAPAPDMTGLEARIARLEERMNEYAPSDPAAAQRKHDAGGKPGAD